MTETNTTRPTPRQAIVGGFLHDWGCAGPSPDEILGRLAAHGYVIVHPDDVPTHHPTEPGVVYDSREQRGWNACRAHIFGDADGGS